MGNLKELENFEAKQKLVGKIFNFRVEEDKILITKYYDSPSREVVKIPDFVDGFEAIDLKSPFKDCRYINKIIADKKNVGTVLRSVFAHTNFEELDLSEFDTSEVINMDLIFNSANIEKLSLTGKFSLKSVTELRGAFMYSTIEDFETEEEFNPVAATCINKAFKRSEIKRLNLQYFDTKNIKYAQECFCASNIKKLILSDRFSTENMKYTRHMFEDAQIDIIDGLGQLDISNADNAEEMFKGFKSIINSLTVIDKSNNPEWERSGLFRHAYLDEINFIGKTNRCFHAFQHAYINTINIENENVINHAKMMDMFAGCSTKKLRVKNTSMTLNEIRDTNLFEESTIIEIANKEEEL